MSPNLPNTSPAVSFVLAAGAVALANEAIFAPVAKGLNHKVDATDIASRVNWRIVPATGILAIALGGLETISPEFARGLGGLVLLAVLIVPVGNNGNPLENVARFFTPTGK